MTEPEDRRPLKGRSLLFFPRRYVCADIETTGLNPRWDEIIEISALRFENGIETGKYSTMVKPDTPIPEFITRLTGISNDMVRNAPSVTEAVAGFRSFVMNDVIVGHNVVFDINFLYDNIAAAGLPALTNDYIDTIRIGRRLLPELDRYRLCDLADACRVTNDRAHRAESDCRCTVGVFEALRQLYERGVWADDPLKERRRARLYVRPGDITTDRTEFNIDSPVYGRVFAFTGELYRFTRRDAMQAVVDRGGIVKGSVTKNTNYLVQGGFERVDVGEDGESTKQKKAREYMLLGQDIHVINEETFLEMLEE